MSEVLSAEFIRTRRGRPMVGDRLIGKPLVRILRSQYGGGGEAPSRAAIVAWFRVLGAPTAPGGSDDALAAVASSSFMPISRYGTVHTRFNELTISGKNAAA